MVSPQQGYIGKFPSRPTFLLPPASSPPLANYITISLLATPSCIVNLTAFISTTPTSFLSKLTRMSSLRRVARTVSSKFKSLADSFSSLSLADQNIIDATPEPSKAKTRKAKVHPPSQSRRPADVARESRDRLSTQEAYTPAPQVAPATEHSPATGEPQHGSLKQINDLHPRVPPPSRYAMAALGTTLERRSNGPLPYVPPVFTPHCRPKPIDDFSDVAAALDAVELCPTAPLRASGKTPRTRRKTRKSSSPYARPESRKEESESLSKAIGRLTITIPPLHRGSQQPPQLGTPSDNTRRKTRSSTKKATRRSKENMTPTEIEPTPSVRQQPETNNDFASSIRAVRQTSGTNIISTTAAHVEESKVPFSSQEFMDQAVETVTPFSEHPPRRLSTPQTIPPTLTVNKSEGNGYEADSECGGSTQSSSPVVQLSRPTVTVTVASPRHILPSPTRRTWRTHYLSKQKGALMGISRHRRRLFTTNQPLAEHPPGNYTRGRLTKTMALIRRCRFKEPNPSVRSRLRRSGNLFIYNLMATMPNRLLNPKEKSSLQGAMSVQPSTPSCAIGVDRLDSDIDMDTASEVSGVQQFYGHPAPPLQQTFSDVSMHSSSNDFVGVPSFPASEGGDFYWMRDEDVAMEGDAVVTSNGWAATAPNSPIVAAQRSGPEDIPSDITQALSSTQVASEAVKPSPSRTIPSPLSETKDAEDNESIIPSIRRPQHLHRSSSADNTSKNASPSTPESPSEPRPSSPLRISSIQLPRLLPSAPSSSGGSLAGVATGALPEASVVSSTPRESPADCKVTPQPSASEVRRWTAWVNSMSLNSRARLTWNGQTLQPKPSNGIAAQRSMNTETTSKGVQNPRRSTTDHDGASGGESESSLD
ncbi:unnamed protein product [Somion occarium]|uniref:Uncharacterized protein n=1 Tax=Somion occarium TaxID=3059160 RepID=A0ABP1CSR3_9APHY